MHAIRNGDIVEVTTDKGTNKFNLCSHNQSELLCICIGKMAMDLVVSNPGIQYNCSTLCSEKIEKK